MTRHALVNLIGLISMTKEGLHGARALACGKEKEGPLGQRQFGTGNGIGHRSGILDRPEGRDRQEFISGVAR